MKLAALLLCFSATSDASSADIYSERPTTVKGCECLGECMTGSMFHCYAADFCYVKSKICASGVAEWSHTRMGHYDYCIHKPDVMYEQLTAAKKKQLVLAHVYADKTGGEYPAAAHALVGIWRESVRLSFESSSDVFPQESTKRLKLIHSRGVTGGIKFVSTRRHPYTGLFKGAEHGVVRFSSAKLPSSQGVTPGMGLKLFRDGRPSANIVAMYSLDGQPCSDKNWFEHTWSNHVPTTNDAGLKLIAKKFWQASNCPVMVGVSDLSTSSAGEVGRFPFRLLFKSSANVYCDCNDYEACLANLEKLPVGTDIFEVLAEEVPSRPGASAKASAIGKIVLTDALSRSTFGDDELFFKHQYMEDDFKHKPEWLKEIDELEQCGMGGVSTDIPPISIGCTQPFAPSELDGLDAAGNSSGMLETDTGTGILYS